jgi:hypothetical protein
LRREEGERRREPGPVEFMERKRGNRLLVTPDARLRGPVMGGYEGGGCS